MSFLYTSKPLEDGRFLQAEATNFGVALVVVVVEATIMCDDVHAIVQSGYRVSVLEGDSQVFIKALRGEIQTSWEIQTLVEDTKLYLNFCIQVLVHHIFEKEN